MLMRFYLGHAVGHTYTHSAHPPAPIETTGDIPECEDAEIVSAPLDHGDGEGSSSESEEDSESTSTQSDAMDVDEDESENEDVMDVNE